MDPASPCCFLAGTTIATLEGIRPVESLAPGDLIITAGHGALPVRWIGRRDYVGRMLNRYDLQHLMPIGMAAGALADGCPQRALFLSPEHKVRIGDRLIAVELLANAMSITRAVITGPIRYYHVELPCHAVVFANGVAVESFVAGPGEDHNRFSNVLDHPAGGEADGTAATGLCLPAIGRGDEARAIHAPLAVRAGQLGFTTTAESGLRLMVDGAATAAEVIDAGTVRFAVPAEAREVHIRSRSVAPAEIDPGNPDRRRLGVCLDGMTLHGAAALLAVEPRHPVLRAGFHDAEGPGAGWRWTDGDARLPPELVGPMAGAFALEVKLKNTGLRYPGSVPEP
jgi:hypothetical protein